MFTRRISSIVLLATVALLTSIAAAAAAPIATRIEGVYANHVNNQQMILGYTDAPYGEGHQPTVRWKAGVSTPVVGPAALVNFSVKSDLDEQGRVVGEAYDFSSFDINNAGATQPTSLGHILSTPDGGHSSIAYPGGAPVFGAAGDVMTVDSKSGTIYRNGAAVLQVAGNAYVQFASDGSFYANSSWYSKLGATPIALPDSSAGGFQIGAGGHLVGTSYDSASKLYSLVRMTVDATTGAVATVTYPNVGGAIRGLEISGKGSIAYGVSADYQTDSLVTFFKIPLDGAVQDVTSLVGGPAARTEVTDINEWGDLTIASFNSAGGTGHTVWSVLLAGSRSALTGQVKQSTAASGRSRAARAKAPSLAGKVVTLTGGATTLTAKTNAKGMFRIDVPAGSGYTLSAPTGTCLVTGNGCHTSTPLATVGESGAPIKLAKVQVPVIASFLQKQHAKVKLASGYKAKLKVRCRAKTACRSTVVLRMGRKVLGSAKVVVPKGKTKVVTITLNKAGKTALTRKAIVPVGATLVTRAGKDRATTALSIKLAR
jgi:hypothetical protein